MAVEVAQSLTQESKVPAGRAGKLTPEQNSVSTLLHELQLGEKLNTCVVEKRRADFSLMLAMLAEDVREQSQFLLPKKATPNDAEHSDDTLRKQLNLPGKSPLCLQTLAEIKQFNQAQFIVDNDLASIQLMNALSPKPLAFRDNKNYISAEIINNTSLFTQLKYQQAQASQGSTGELDKPLNQTLTFNAKAWLAGIEESIVKAPLLN